MEKSERHQYNGPLQDYCNHFYDKMIKTTKMRRKMATEKIKTQKR